MRPAERQRLAQQVALAAGGVDGVVGLVTGPFASVATYGGGARVPGVRVHAPDHVRVDVAVRYGVDVAAVADEVRAAVASVAGGVRVDVRVVDVGLVS